MTGDSPIRVFGKLDCADTARTRALLAAESAPFVFIDVEASSSAAAQAAELGGSPRVPVVVFPDGDVLVEPDDDEVRARLG